MGVSSAKDAAKVVAKIAKEVSVSKVAKGDAKKAKPHPLSSAMRSFVGRGESNRPQLLKDVWTYIKSHNLQNPQNRREILCDDKLKSIFEGKDKVTNLELMGLLHKHVLKSPQTQG